MFRKIFFLIGIISILSPLNAIASTQEFCKGFERGYITGYKKASGSSLDPLVPLCPLQPLKNLNDPDSDFEQGYIIGLQAGIENGSKR